MPHTCSTCRHFVRAGAAPRPTACMAVGECRASPPATSYAWPRVREADFCSQWRDTADYASAATMDDLVHRGPAATTELFGAGTTGEASLGQTVGCPREPEPRASRAKRARTA